MPSSFQSNTEALIAILEECLELADGHPFRGTDALIQYLADIGLLVVCKDGWGHHGQERPAGVVQVGEEAHLSLGRPAGEEIEHMDDSHWPPLSASLSHLH